MSRPDRMRPPTPSQGSDARQRRLGALALAGAALLLYLPLLGADFSYDDEGLLPALARRPWAGILTRSLWPASVADIHHLAWWRPLQEIDFKAGLALFGPSPAVFHAESLLLHLAVGLALYVWLLGRAAQENLWAALLPAGLFLLHPAHQEAVAFIAARNDLWAALAVIGAAMLWRSPLAWLAPAVVAVGMGFKETAAVAVVLLPALDLAERRSFQGRGVALAALIAVVPVYLAVRVGLADQALPPPPPVDPNLSFAPLIHAGALLTGLHTVAVNQPISLLFQQPAWWIPGVVGTGALVVGLGRSAVGRVGLLFWALTLSLALPPAVATDNYADRYLYIPDIGLCLGLAELLRARAWSPAARGIAGGAMGLLAVANAHSLPRWASSETLWRYGAARDPTGYSADQLGVVLLAKGDRDAAISAFRAALAGPYPWVDAREALGIALLQEGKLDEGCPLLQSVELPNSNPQTVGSLIRCAAARGDLAQARALLSGAGASPSPPIALEGFALALATADSALQQQTLAALAASGVSEEKARMLLRIRP